LLKLGEKREFLSWNNFHLAHKDELELAEKLMKLRDIGIPFAGANSGWSPAGIVSCLIEKSFFHGEYQEIIWSKPGLILLYDVKSSGNRILNKKIE
jgi:hypothetical protein